MIRPEKSLNIKVSNKPDELQRVYDIGKRTGLAEVERVKKYLEQ